MPFLAPLPLPTLEHLAAELQPVTFDAGGCVMREGDPGDRFYVVREGELRVIHDDLEVADGRPRRLRGRDRAAAGTCPRTATVTAVGQASLFALDRDEFLAAVTGHASSSSAADSAMLMRLQSLGLAR